VDDAVLPIPSSGGISYKGGAIGSFFGSTGEDCFFSPTGGRSYKAAAVNAPVERLGVIDVVGGGCEVAREAKDCSVNEMLFGKAKYK
jgi:hypothetical protein